MHVSLFFCLNKPHWNTILPQIFLLKKKKTKIQDANLVESLVALVEGGGDRRMGYSGLDTYDT